MTEPLTVQQRLAALWDRYAQEPALEELRAGATQLVRPVGVVPPKFAIIGEAPGREEDLRGEPFCGRSGVLLDECLNLLGLHRDVDVWITNTVKYRPPNNRDPELREIAASAPYLRAELMYVMGWQPVKWVVPLGRHALSLWTDEPITGIAGTVLVRGRWRIYPMMHPAYVLRNRGILHIYQEKWRDLCKHIEDSGVGL